jgi:hypothetical protein
MSLRRRVTDTTDRRSPMRRPWSRPGAVLFLIAFALLPVLWPFTNPGFPVGHDAGAHLTYVYRLDHALSEGQFPVRWVEATKPGHGQPLFNAYQVGFSYLVALLHQVVPLSYALKAMPPLLWWTGAGFMFLLCRRFGRVPAAVATVVYGLSPYLIVDVFVRAAYPEFAAINWGVGVLWALDRLLTTRSVACVPVLAVLTGLMLICHLPATLIMTPMFAAYTLHLWLSRQITPGRLRLAFFGGALGVGLASFYLWPALLELHLTQARRLTTGGADFHRHFVPLAQFSRFGFGYAWNFGAAVQDVADLLPLDVAAVEWAVIAAGGSLLLAQFMRGRIDERGTASGAWLGVIAFALFMMTRASGSVWETVTPLAYIQFPWRFFLLISIAAAALVAPLVSLLNGRAQALVLITVVALQTNLYHRQLKPSGSTPRERVNIDNPRWRETQEGRSWGFIEHAYDPIAVTAPPTDTGGRWQITAWTGTVYPRVLKDDRIILDVLTERGMTVTINSPYFPGWTVRLDDTIIEPTVRPGDGYMDAQVPPGEHRLEAEFRNTPVRTWSNTISLVSVLLVGLAVAWASRPGRHTRIHVAPQAESG